MTPQRRALRRPRSLVGLRDTVILPSALTNPNLSVATGEKNRSFNTPKNGGDACPNLVPAFVISQYQM